MKTFAMLMLSLLAAVTARAQPWRPSGGPEGGDVMAMAASGTTVLATAGSGRLYRHDEMGWRALGETNLTPIHAVGGTFIARGYDGIYRSTDRGEHWTRAALEGTYYRLAIDGTTLYVAVDTVFYRSTDAGAAWSRIGAFDTNDFFSFFVHDSVILIGRGNGEGLYRSGDLGRRWSRVADGLPAGNPPTSFGMADGSFYLATNREGIFRSDDGGLRWSAVNEGLRLPSGLYPLVDQFLAVGDEVWAAGLDGTFARRNGTWRPISLDEDRALAQAGGIVYRGSSTGIAATNDMAKSWRTMNGGLRAHRIAAMAEFRGMALASAGGSIYRSADEGDSWTRAVAIDIRKFAAARSAVYAVGFSYFRPGLFRSVDGLDWGDIGDSLPHEARRISAMMTVGDTLFLGFYGTEWRDSGSVWTDGGIYRSTDGGRSWMASTGLPNNGRVDVPVTDLIAAGPALLAVTHDGVYRSTNGGAHWTRSHAGLPDELLLARFAVAGGTISLTRGSANFLSTDGGESWHAPAVGFPSNVIIHNLSTVRGAIHAIGYDTASRSRVFRLNGERWDEIAARFPDDIYLLSFIEVGAKVLAATAWNSVWIGTLDGQSGVEGVGGKAERLELR